MRAYCITSEQAVIHTSNIGEEEANLAVSGVVMNLLMEEELDVSDGAEISFIGEFTSPDWAAITTVARPLVVKY